MYVDLIKCPLELSDFSETAWTDVRKELVQNLMKTRSVGAELFHADGHT